MDKKEYVGKFVGKDKIEDVVLSEKKTYLRNDKVEVSFKDKEAETYPLEALKSFVTDKATDLSELQERKVVPVVRKILAIITEAELGKVDMEYAIGAKLKNSLDMNYNKAMVELWGKEIDKISLFDVNAVLTTAKEKKV